MDLFRSYKYRIYPNKAQLEVIKNTQGCCRFVYNLLWGTIQTNYKDHGLRKVDKFTLIRSLTDVKREYDWLKNAIGVSLQQSVLDLYSGYVKFFKGFKKDPTIKPPKPKKKSTSASFRLVGTSFSIQNGVFRVTKMGKLKIRLHRELPSQPSSATIITDIIGRHFVVFTCKVSKKVKEPTGESIGLDVGIKSLAVTSNGEVIDNPRHYKAAESRLSTLQRKLSRTIKGSRRFHNFNLMFRRLSIKIASKRRDFLHKLSRRLVNENQLIGLEGLNVKNMMGNHKLAKHIQDSSWGMLKTFLIQKAMLVNVKIVVISSYFPSTHICNMCNDRLSYKLKLNQREWVCENCGTTHDRDHNAALNIRNEAMRIFTEYGARASTHGVVCGSIE